MEELRLAEEDALLAEIRRIAGGSLEIGEIFETLAAAIRKLVHYDRLSIRFVDLEEGTFKDAHVTGLDIPGRRVGDVVPLKGTFTEAAISAPSALRLDAEPLDAVLSQYPQLRSALDAGVRSLLAVPLLNRDRATAVLMAASVEPEDYSEHHLQLAQRVGAKIADAIANSMAYESLKSAAAEDKREATGLARKLGTIRQEVAELRQRVREREQEAMEHQALSEIGQAAGSSLELDGEVYQALAPKIRSLVSYDRLEFAALDLDAGTATNVYAGGTDMSGWKAGATMPISGTPAETLARTNAGLVVGAGSSGDHETGRRPESESSQAGFASIMAVPLVSGGKVLAALTFRSAKPGAYSERELALGERIATQAAGAFTSSHRHARVRREAEEQAALARIGQLAASVSDFGQVYDAFAAQVSLLLSFDRIAVAYVDHDLHAATNAYASGAGASGSQEVASFEISSEAFEAIAGTRTGTIAAARSPGDFAERFPRWSLAASAPVCSLLAVPLISDDEAFGTLILSSTSPDAYAESDLALARRIGAQIAGPVYSARLNAQLWRTADESKVLEQIDRVVAKSPSLEEGYAGVAEQLRELLPFDRIAIATVDAEDGTLTNRYVSGIEANGGQAGVAEPLVGTAIEGALGSGRGLIVQGEDPEQIGRRLPALVPGIESGLRSFMEVPITIGGKAVGSIGLGSTRLYAYVESHRALIERVGFRIASMVLVDRLRVEHELDTREKAVLADIGRVITSSVDIRQVYDRLAEQVRRLIPFDRIAIWSVDLAGENLVAAYVSGADDPGREQDIKFPLARPAARVTTTESHRSAVGDELAGKLPAQLTEFLQSAGGALPSLLVVPLVLGDETVGMLSLRSTVPNAYIQRDAALAERIAAQVAGAVANGQLYLEARQVEAAVHQVVERLDLAVKGSGDGLWDWKILDNETWWSPRFKELVGHQEGDEDGGPGSWESRLHPEDRDRVLNVLKKHLETRAPYDVEYRLSTGSREYRWFSDRGQATREDDGNPIRMAGSLRDITEAKFAASQTPGPHNLTAPLLSIEIFKRALVDDISEGQSDDAHGYAVRLLAAGRQLRQVMAGLENLSWASEAEISRRLLDLGKLTRLVASKLRKERGNRKVTVSIARGLQVEGDEALLRVMMEKLLDNAWKFSANRKRARMVLGVDKRDGEKVYSLRDNGVGFNIANADNLFGLFQRLHPAGEFEGAGLGLATVRHIVQRHGGRTWAEAQVGRGATFYFTLPSASG